MKKTKFIFTIAAAFLMVSAPWFFTSCDNSDDSSSESAKSDPAVAEDSSLDADLLDFTAFRVLRALCSLPTDADASNGEVAGSGIELLPEGWQAMTFESDEGYILDPDNPTVRSVAVAGLDDAKEYVSSVVGEEIDGDSFSWFDSALGSLRFKAGSGEDIFATLDVSISQIENLTQIQFVSASYLEDSNINSENSFSGIPYYAAGDIIRRKSDDSYWICVRPAGGPYKKENSYWIELTHNYKYDDPDKSKKTYGKELYYEKTYTLPRRPFSLIDYSEGNDDRIELDEETFIYEKNLMSLKTAKAAAHTFHLIMNLSPNDKYFTKCPLPYGIKPLHALATDEKGNTVDDSIRFNFAYESPKKDSVRSKSHPSSISHARGKIPAEYKKYFAKYALVELTQPFLRTVSELKGGMLVMTMDTKRKETIVTPDKESLKGKMRSAEFLYSLTDTHDPGFLYTIQSPISYWPYDATEYDLNDSSGVYGGWPRFRYDFVYDLENGDLGNWMLMEHVILSSEIKIADNKGKGGEAIKPDESYEDYFRQEAGFNSGKPTVDYWGSLFYTTHVVDGKTITDWKKENN